jgi:hypothetical protein
MLAFNWGWNSENHQFWLVSIHFWLVVISDLTFKIAQDRQKRKEFKYDDRTAL